MPAAVEQPAPIMQITCLLGSSNATRMSLNASVVAAGSLVPGSSLTKLITRAGAIAGETVRNCGGEGELRSRD